MESPACSPIKLSSLCLAVGMALSTPVLAQDTESHFEEVVVWGTKVSSNTESMFADDMSRSKRIICLIYCAMFPVWMLVEHTL